MGQTPSAETIAKNLCHNSCTVYMWCLEVQFKDHSYFPCISLTDCNQRYKLLTYQLQTAAIDRHASAGMIIPNKLQSTPLPSAHD